MHTRRHARNACLTCCCQSFQDLVLLPNATSAMCPLNSTWHALNAAQPEDWSHEVLQVRSKQLAIALTCVKLCVKA